MYLRLSSILGLLAVFTLSGCAKLKDEMSSPQGLPSEDNLYLMVGALALPLPDKSYAAKSQSEIQSADSNVRALTLLVDTAAAPLREMNMHLAQTISQGQRPSGTIYLITLTAPSFQSELKGTRDDAQGVTNWTYTLNKNIYFSGTQANVGTRGDLSFPSSNLSVHWEQQGSERTINLRQGATATLDFKSKYSSDAVNPSVTLSGHVSGSLEVKGEWNANGGWYQEGTNKYCWNSSLSNVACGK